MARSSLMKLVLAFVAGLVVALGSALIFVQARQPQTAVPVTEIEQQQPPAAEPEQKTPPEAAQKTETAEPSHPERSQAEPSRTEPSHAEPSQPEAAAVKPKIAKRSAPRNWGKGSQSPILPPVQVVQNTPPALPAVPAPAPGYPALSQPVQEEAVPAAVATPPAQPHVVELAEGTYLAIRLGETISSEHNYTGDAFRGALEEPIIRNGFIIAEKGSKVLGRIVNATQAGRVRGVSNLNVTLTEINTTDGQRIKVQTNSVEKEGSKSTGTDAAKIGGGAALGALIGALGGGGKGAAIGAGAGGAAGTGVVLATRGKAAILPNEARLVFQLVSPVTITEKLNH